MLAAAPVAALNHLLGRETWARDRLVTFAGKRVLFTLPPFPTLGLAILDNGLVEQAGDAAEFDLTVRLTPALLPRLVLRDPTAARSAEISGDVELARTIEFLFEHLRWDAEDDLARAVGDVPAHRLATGARAAAAWQRDAGERLARNVAEFLTEEKAVVASSADVREFVAGVDEVRDAVERLEKQIARLGTARRPGSG
jgi:ubiquinone biosynthesis protein UbiJ